RCSSWTARTAPPPVTPRSCSTASPPAARAEQPLRASRRSSPCAPAGQGGGAGRTDGAGGTGGAGRDKLLVGGVTSTPQRASAHASDKKLVRRPATAPAVPQRRPCRSAARRPTA